MTRSMLISNKLFHVDSSSSVNIDEFENLKNLWWSLLNRVNDLRRVWFSIDWRDRDFINWRDQDWFAERCLFFRLKTFSRRSMIVSSWVSIVIWLISNSSSLLMWSTWTSIHCSLSFKVMSRWSLSSISILMISSDWLIAHWRSCWLMLMFHEIATFWNLAEASTEIRETHLLAMLLSKQAVRDSTDSESHVIVRKVKVGLIVVDLINLSKFE